MKILVTRPSEDGRHIAARLAEMGHRALLAPLLEPRFLDGPEPALDDVQAILATSANGVRALIRRTPRRDIPIFAVGPQTAEEATRAGFNQVRSADGDAVALAEAAARWARPDGVLLHVCGEDAPGTLADTLAARGFAVRRAVLYGMAAAAELPSETRAALRDGRLDAAMFFSPRTAGLFLELAQGLPIASLTAFCISPNTARALPHGAFADVRVAAKPNQTAMLDLVGPA
ncbi:MAG TPA: uroporphyrinogen-III synthase [Rhizomicrobium sp.]